VRGGGGAGGDEKHGEYRGSPEEAAAGEARGHMSIV
jgi:hypothetical protein